MNSSLHDVDLGQQFQESNQTIFLATRMDLMAQIVPKREKPKKDFMSTKSFTDFSEAEKKPTIH
ncbi:MAG: hypothetical protein HQL71_10345 [Magnetococcales bacterium]|nr:hypothetical protein [Magnetococcales bacterium]